MNITLYRSEKDGRKSKTRSEEVMDKIYPNREVERKTEKTNWYLMCKQCRDVWLLEVHELKKMKIEIYW